MDNKAAHYDLIRDNNKRLIRNLVREYKITTKTELGEYSGLSFPTVSAVLNELIKEGEILTMSGNSNGGRPGAVFQLNPAFSTIVCAILSGYQLLVQIYDYCGERLESFSKTIDEQADEDLLEKIFEDIKKCYPKTNTAIIGIPGIAIGGVIKHLPYLPKLEGKDIKQIFMDKLDVLLFLENDINMIAMGETNLAKDFAHLLWDQGCVGSAIVLEGKLLRGSHGCAGELEFVCNQDSDMMTCLLQALYAIVCVIDVPVIAISGGDVSKDHVEKLKKVLESQLATFRIPEVIYVPNEESLYEKGLWQIAMEYYS